MLPVLPFNQQMVNIVTTGLTGARRFATIAALFN